MRFWIYSCLALIVFGVVVWGANYTRPTRPVWGVNFEIGYARYLGFDEKKLFLEMVEQWGVKHVRLSVPWNLVEPQEGVFDFSSIDNLLATAQAHNVSVVLAVGNKLPRWPECHTPAWVTSESLGPAVMNMLAKVVDRYRSNPAIVSWQVENEPYFPFGDCPVFDNKLLAREVAFVRSRDSRPIVITDSGEMGDWFRAAAQGDELGITLYRKVHNPWIGYFEHFLPPIWYTAHMDITRILFPKLREIFIAEGQAEAWSAQGVLDVPVADQANNYSLNDLRRALRYMGQVGSPRVYLWGAEWWAWMAQQGYPEYRDEIVSLLREGN